MKLAAFAGRFVLFLAGMALITGVSLFIVGGYLTTYPIMRLSAKNRRVQALIGIGVAAMALANAYRGTEDEA